MVERDPAGIETKKLGDLLLRVNWPTNACKEASNECVRRDVILRVRKGDLLMRAHM